jgi:hypothetical protein
MEEQLTKIFLILCFSQFLFPVLALMIKGRFREIGYAMDANPYLSLFNLSGFWVEAREAREANKTYNDERVRTYLLCRSLWWVFAIVIFIGIALS